MRHLCNLARSTVLVAAIVSMVGCEVQFEEHITPLVMSTAVTQPSIGAPGPVGTVSPADASATAEAEVILTLVAFAQSQELSPNRRGDPRIASYEEVWCGDINRVCYELCYQSECGIYDATGPRVSQFIVSVNQREIKIIEWESRGRTGIALNFSAFGTCAGTLVAGAQVYALVTAVDPEPISKTILAVGGGIVAGVLCGGSLIGRSNVGTDQAVLEAEIERQRLIAEQAFDYLQQYGEEADVNAGP
jgi:hypothetical protein